jgi:hypothetical protein
MIFRSQPSIGISISVEVAAMIASLLAASLAAAPTGLYFEQTTVLHEEGRAEAPGVRSRVWCEGPRMRLEPADGAGGPALILRLDEGRALRLDPESRVATELDATRLRARSQTDASVAAGLMGGPGEEGLRTVALTTRRTIAGHRCQGFRIKGASVTVDVWVAPDLPLRADVFADFLEWSGAGQALSGLVDAIRALPGFPLETRFRIDVFGTVRETVSTVTLIRLTRAPRGHFEVPAGWRTLREAPPKEVGP